jgi:hypothetical protein
MKVLFGKWPVLHMMLGVTIASFGSYGSGAFVPPYFVRDLRPWPGPGRADRRPDRRLLGRGRHPGRRLPGRLGGQAERQVVRPGAGHRPADLHADLHRRLSADGLADHRLILLVPGIFHYTYLAPTFGVVQNSVEPRRRATATALLFFFLNLIALGGGPVFTGWLIDHLAQFNFNNPASSGRSSTPWAVRSATRRGQLHAQCPGGLAPKGSPPTWPRLCNGAMAHSTQQGIIVSLCFYAWAGLHYALAAIGMVKHMRERAAAQA